MNELEQRKLLSALCHGAIFFSTAVVSIAIPIAIFFVSNDTVVKENAKESLNFHLTLYIYAALAILLVFVVIGIPLLGVLFIASWVMPVVAIVQVLADPHRPYSYPFVLRLV